MRVLWYLPADRMKGVLAERYHNTLIKYSLDDVCWKVP
jgi:hypothetical protein